MRTLFLFLVVLYWFLCISTLPQGRPWQLIDFAFCWLNVVAKVLQCCGKSGLKRSLDVKRSRCNHLMYSFIAYDFTTRTARLIFLRTLLLIRSWLICLIHAFEFCDEEVMIPVRDLEQESRGSFEKSTWS